MNIVPTRATVLLKEGTDSVSIHTELPSALPKVSSQPLSLSFEAEIDTGIAYVKRVFGIEPTVINVRRTS